jgi:hypothetical protein
MGFARSNSAATLEADREYKCCRTHGDAISVRLRDFPLLQLVSLVSFTRRSRQPSTMLSARFAPAA